MHCDETWKRVHPEQGADFAYDQVSGLDEIIHLMLSPRFSDALIYAAELHKHQRRKGTTIPYFSHLMAVCSLVMENGGDEDCAIAALLHDAIEDQGGDATRQVIATKFGPRVADIVSGCTDADEIPKPPWRERKEAYIAHLVTASPDVLLVSLSDKVHNARAILMDFRAINNEVWDRFSPGKTGTLWYYRALVGAFHDAGAHSGLQTELNRIITELERLSHE